MPQLLQPIFSFSSPFAVSGDIVTYFILGNTNRSEIKIGERIVGRIRIYRRVYAQNLILISRILLDKLRQFIAMTAQLGKLGTAVSEACSHEELAVAAERIDIRLGMKGCTGEISIHIHL